MIKLRLLILCLALAGFLCPARPALAETFRVLASTYPIWLFCRNVCENVPNVKVELLVPAKAGCPHDYSPGPADLAKLENASILVINGLGLEDFLLKARQTVAPDLPIADAGRDVAPLLQSLEDPKPGHPNPHIFAAPRQASIMVANIALELGIHNPENNQLYQANARAYAEKLWKIGLSFQCVGINAPRKAIALQHDALAYIAQNADLDIVAMLPGGSAPAAARLARLQKELREAAPVLLATDSQYPNRIALMLSGETGIPTAALDPVANGPEDAPLDYYETTMEKNRQILEKYYK